MQVTLKNGRQLDSAIVNIAMARLKRLMEDDRGPTSLYELVRKCRDPRHEPWGLSVFRLKEVRLIEADGSLNEVLAEIVLCATQGEGFTMTVGSPLKEE